MSTDPAPPPPPAVPTITKRELFAGVAMLAYIVSDPKWTRSHDQISVASLASADNLLHHLEKQKGPNQ